MDHCSLLMFLYAYQLTVLQNKTPSIGVNSYTHLNPPETSTLLSEISVFNSGTATQYRKERKIPYQHIHTLEVSTCTH